MDIPEPYLTRELFRRWLQAPRERPLTQCPVLDCPRQVDLVATNTHIPEAVKLGGEIQIFCYKLYLVSTPVSAFTTDGINRDHPEPNSNTNL